MLEWLCWQKLWFICVCVCELIFNDAFFQAFSKVDTHKQGSIHLSDIKKFFNANCPYKPGSGRFQDHACFICVLLITGRNPLSVNFYLCTKKVVAYLAQESEKEPFIHQHPPLSRPPPFPISAVPFIFLTVVSLYVVIIILFHYECLDY